MMRKSAASVSVHWYYRGVNWEQKRDMLRTYAERLKPIDPLLAHFSPQGKKYGWGPMLKQPEILDMSDEQWAKLLDMKKDHIQFLSFWNRQKDDENRIYFRPSFNEPVSWGEGASKVELPFGNGIGIHNLPKHLENQDLMEKLNYGDRCVNP